MTDVYIPYFRSSDSLWSSSKLNETNPMVKVNFLNQLENFVSMLRNAQESLDDRIRLKPCERIHLEQLQNSADYLAMASNSENLQAMEETLKIWIQQMEKVGQSSRFDVPNFPFCLGFGRKRTDSS